MGDGRGDFQRVWHEFAGRYFEGKRILDVGGGYGYSRPRLAQDGRNHVMLQDIDRSLMNVCDLIVPIRDLVVQERWWDVVTAFDVIEHAHHPPGFFRDALALARDGALVTTPARRIYDHPWHFYPAEILEMAAQAGALVDQSPLFARYHEGDRDEVVEVDRDVFLNDVSIYAHGIYARRGGG